MILLFYNILTTNILKFMFALKSDFFIYLVYEYYIFVIAYIFFSYKGVEDL